MKPEKIGLEIAALKKELKKPLPNVIKTKIEAKITRLEKELKGTTLTGVEFARNLLAGKKKVNAMTKTEFNDFVKLLSKKPEYDFLKYLTKEQIKNDLDRVAKPVGWRFKGRTNFGKPTKTDIRLGKNVYYENRSNRSDVSTVVRLAKGGMVKHGLEVGDEIMSFEGNLIFIQKNGKSFVVNINKGERYDSRAFNNMSDKKQLAFSKMAKGGGIEHSTFKYYKIPNENLWAIQECNNSYADEYGTSCVVIRTKKSESEAIKEVERLNSMGMHDYYANGEYVVADLEYNILGSFKTEEEAKKFAQQKSKETYEIIRYGEREKIERYAKEDGYMAKGGNLKPIPKGNKGLPKLPKKVRNKMGFMEDGGEIIGGY